MFHSYDSELEEDLNVLVEINDLIAFTSLLNLILRINFLKEEINKLKEFLKCRPHLLITNSVSAFQLVIAGSHPASIIEFFHTV